VSRDTVWNIMRTSTHDCIYAIDNHSQLIPYAKTTYVLSA